MVRRQPVPDLARRERQIMDVFHQMGEASVADVLERLKDPPSYSAVRTMIRHLETKGLLRHRQEGKRYLYQATQSRESASRSALRKLLDVLLGLRRCRRHSRRPGGIAVPQRTRTDRVAGSTSPS
ncbi:MAG: BlaI/MecI/CopY family transcriptional regulator [Planctomycetota bacterium]|nr:BlaI/MecI/CopY family transcriptional regulator [Planctomycetota bacterium]